MQTCDMWFITWLDWTKKDRPCGGFMINQCDQWWVLSPEYFCFLLSLVAGAMGSNSDSEEDPLQADPDNCFVICRSGPMSNVMSHVNEWKESETIDYILTDSWLVVTSLLASLFCRVMIQAIPMVAVADVPAECAVGSPADWLEAAFAIIGPANYLASFEQLQDARKTSNLILSYGSDCSGIDAPGLALRHLFQDIQDSGYRVICWYIGLDETQPDSWLMLWHRKSHDDVVTI